ncbi:hypothetical protein Desku_1589 [Desulfofundulus kuznetsovii DSM 6115]|jgi:hypothetical protein|uniref:Uncharacterized protein n=1 Tax=Desulfofundulus kuznetsovii (strain DSM 6115 / VKM B-1805 / 17) TaxID=760568 RepID=A0AAU8PHQ9_DESK7|nr:hypothetical protein Desku_1589 [Desulfofundulus kuznetsovii DSM 6115]
MSEFIKIEEIDPLEGEYLLIISTDEDTDTDLINEFNEKFYEMMEKYHAVDYGENEDWIAIFDNKEVAEKVAKEIESLYPELIVTREF